MHTDTVAYSWWSYRAGAREKNIGWRIDYVLTSQPLLEHIRDAFILPEIMGSDHCPVGIEIAL
jgi:exodeoxyribonuclease-3